MRLGTFLAPSGTVTVAVFLSVECSHVNVLVVCRIALCISALAFHKETEESRAIGGDHATSKCRASGIDHHKNGLAQANRMTRG